MDPNAGTTTADLVKGIVVTGAGHVVLDPNDPSARRTGCDPSRWLRVRKSRKYMGLQDDLAVASAGLAIESAGLQKSQFGARAGLYLAVGYISFEQEDIIPVLEGSLENGRFSMSRFSDDGLRRAHPLLTFRCLPNMPAYHVSANFDVQGPYLVTYPGVAQYYQALEEACAALRAGEIEVALVGGVANQLNFLVAHHFRRIDEPVADGVLRDAGAFLVLERAESASGRGATVRARVSRMSLDYATFPAERTMPSRREVFRVPTGTITADDELGPASLAAMISRELGRGGTLMHEIDSRDGLRGASTWEIGA